MQAAAKRLCEIAPVFGNRWKTFLYNAGSMTLSNLQPVSRVFMFDTNSIYYYTGVEFRSHDLTL